MNIKSLTDEYTKYNREEDIYDITTPSFKWNSSIRYMKYTVQKGFDMRMDLILQDIYDLSPGEADTWIHHIDVICYINHIDNPINIKEDTVLIVPDALDSLDDLRISLEAIKDNSDVREKLIVPNKSTKKDKNREKFKENGYSIPPTVRDVPKPPVDISGGKISVGGL